MPAPPEQPDDQPQARHDRAPGRIFVRDLGTTNGTVLNDRNLRGEEAEAADGDRLTIGPLAFSISIEPIGSAIPRPDSAVYHALEEGPTSAEDPTVLLMPATAPAPSPSPRAEAAAPAAGAPARVGPEQAGRPEARSGSSSSAWSWPATSWSSPSAPPGSMTPSRPPARSATAWRPCSSKGIRTTSSSTSRRSSRSPGGPPA